MTDTGELHSIPTMLISAQEIWKQCTCNTEW